MWSSSSPIAAGENRLPTVIPKVILCVDDDPKSLMARRLMLVLEGYDVLTAYSGEAALNMLRRRPVDVVISDHFLPAFTGAELARAVKLMKPETLVVLLTWAGETPAGAEHADLVLQKGMSPEKFLDEVARLTGSQRTKSAGNSE